MAAAVQMVTVLDFLAWEILHPSPLAPRTVGAPLPPDLLQGLPGMQALLVMPLSVGRWGWKKVKENIADIYLCFSEVLIVPPVILISKLEKFGVAGITIT